MSNLVPRLLVILQEINIHYIHPSISKTTFELNWNGKINYFRLKKDKKGTCSLSISHQSKLLKLRACYELSDLSINRTIKFHANL